MSEAHNVLAEKVSKIALSANGIKENSCLIESSHIHMIQALREYARHSCWNTQK